MEERKQNKNNLEKFESNYVFLDDGLSTLEYKVLKKDKIKGCTRYVVEV